MEKLGEFELYLVAMWNIILGHSFLKFLGICLKSKDTTTEKCTVLVLCGAAGKR